MSTSHDRFETAIKASARNANRQQWLRAYRLSRLTIRTEGEDGIVRLTGGQLDGQLRRVEIGEPTPDWSLCLIADRVLASRRNPARLSPLGAIAIAQLDADFSAMFSVPASTPASVYRQSRTMAGR